MRNPVFSTVFSDEKYRVVLRLRYRRYEYGNSVSTNQVTNQERRVATERSGNGTRARPREILPRLQVCRSKRRTSGGRPDETVAYGRSVLYKVKSKKRKILITVLLR